MHVYGADLDKLSQLVSEEEHSTSLSPEIPITKSQVLWAVREEMAMTLEDVLARRTRSLFLNAKASDDIAPEVAKIMADEMGKNAQWIADQLNQFKTVSQHYFL